MLGCRAPKHQASIHVCRLPGAKLFYLAGLRNGKYLQREILNLARFIAVMKFRPLSWRTAHPYLLTDRFEVPCLRRLSPMTCCWTACPHLLHVRAHVAAPMHPGMKDDKPERLTTESRGSCLHALCPLAARSYRWGAPPVAWDVLHGACKEPCCACFQDITPPERVAADALCDREVTLYGFLRGANLKPGARAHLAGVGDLPVSNDQCFPSGSKGAVRLTCSPAAQRAVAPAVSPNVAL